MHAGFVLAGVTPTVLAGLLGEPAPDAAPGAQVKVNLMLRRLPRLRDESRHPRAGVRRHIPHQRDAAANSTPPTTPRRARRVPDPLPCEIYCHSLTDPTILSDELRASGAQTLTVFGLHTPHSLVAATAIPTGCATRLTYAVLASLNSVLAEPIQDVLMDGCARAGRASRRRRPPIWSTRWA